MATKIIILVLVVIGVLVLMALGAGAYRDKREGGRPRKSDTDSPPGIVLIDRATGWMRSKFDIRRLQGCGRDGRTILVVGSCEMKVAPGSSRRPSRFKLAPASGEISLCFALGRKQLKECIESDTQPKMGKLEKAADFTVTRDSAFLFLRCDDAGTQGCRVLAR